MAFSGKRAGIGAAKGAAGGALTGATLGSWFPVVGTGAGAGIGAAGGGLLGLLEGFLSEGGYEQVDRFTPEQKQRQNEVGQMGLEALKNPYQGWGDIEKQAMNQYSQQVIPEAVNYFGRSSGGARLSSPNFASQLADQSTGLSALLNEQKMRYGDKNRAFGMQQLNFGGDNQFENVYRPADAGWSDDLLNLGAQFAGANLLQGGFGGGSGAGGKKDTQAATNDNASFRERFSQLTPEVQKMFINQLMQKRAQGQFNNAMQQQLPANMAPQSRGAGSIPISPTVEAGMEYRNPRNEFGKAFENYFPGLSGAQSAKSLQSPMLSPYMPKVSSQERARYGSRQALGLPGF